MQEISPTIVERNDCNGLSEKPPEKIDWQVHKDKENTFSIKYPSNFLLITNENGFSLNIKNQKPAILNFRVEASTKDGIKGHLIKFPPNNHAGLLSDATYEERLKNAEMLLNYSESISVGTANGYKILIPDVLLREILYWNDKKNTYILSFSPEDKSFGCTGSKKEQIVDYMIKSFTSIY